MKLNTLIFAAVAAVSLTGSIAQARPAHHHRHHHNRSHVSFGFNVGAPVVYRPVVYRPCVVAHPYFGYAPVVYPAPYVRPSMGVSFGSGPVNFGFSF